MLRTSWAYSLKRDELLKYLTRFEQDATGNVEDIRKRLAKFLSLEHPEERLQQLLDLQMKHETISSANTLKLPTATETEYNHHSFPSKMDGGGLSTILIGDNGSLVNYAKSSTPNEERVTVIELVRKWGIKYNGGKDPLGFIELIEELAEMYDAHCYEGGQK